MGEGYEPYHGSLKWILRNPPVQGVRNGRMVVLATGESLLGPVLRKREACLPISGILGSGE
jgi:hypothetical protein